MENILLPSTLRYEASDRPHEARLIVEPCFHGYGTTLGNALRRVLLSSLPGAAVTSVKIKGVTHEFQAIEHIKEDALAIILNLKMLRCRLFGEGPAKLHLKVKGKKTVTAADFEKNAEIEIVNSDLTIATVTDDKGTLDIEVTIERGRGFYPVELRSKESNDIGVIAVDAIFSPVRNVAYKVENTRVGDITDYDRLTMTIETDGSITPQEAVDNASAILIDYFSVLGHNSGASQPSERGSSPVGNESE